MTALALRGRTRQQESSLPDTRPDSRSDQEDKSVLIGQWIEYGKSLGLKHRSARFLVRYYLDHITGDVDFYSWMLMHADPTGETATRNVMRERSE